MKEIEGWPGYCITEDGDAISFKGKNPKVLNQSLSNGYLKVNLYKDGEKQTITIHRLVAEAFIPNPLGLPEVNHKNEDKTDNRIDNLEWCTKEYNNNYGTRNKRAAEALRGKKKSDESVAKRSKPVIAYIYESGEYYGEYPSVSESARQLGLNPGNITQCCKGNRKQIGGFTFRYKDGE